MHADLRNTITYGSVSMSNQESITTNSISAPTFYRQAGESHYELIKTVALPPYSHNRAKDFAYYAVLLMVGLCFGIACLIILVMQLIFKSLGFSMLLILALVALTRGYIKRRQKIHPSK